MADYDTVRFDYKFVGRPPHANLRRLFKEWIDLGDHPLHCTVVAARAEQREGDALGEVEFSDYIATGSRLLRQIVLTSAGGLAVIDRFTPGPRTEGWAAGQLWQMYAIADRGTDWFESASDGAYAQADGSVVERRMLIKFMTGDGVAIHEEQVVPGAMHALRADGTKHASYHTVGSKQIVADRVLTSAMVVLPIAMDDDAATVAARVQFERAGNGTVRVRLPAKTSLATITATPAGMTIRREQ